ncbi:photosystem II manganese-stabilizing polypeptide [Acaryochloris marina]|uniref:Photosystem II extrinsic protein O n=1 Tax=Acaryochloris marina (strain MBIC 11017) TaxID=329726 RepID=B0CC36_ACAM1|nr:photosystem II manganese-stabilizing polypeptide [Acaryochloris marina]ABW25578.1 photosystem II manganese-stabilizing protein PsbO [Acaryochloris marina MBIC11017]BDM80458.1 photosystem II manganese-stabilizing polypeptide [Acaryochloris marina MBIC10699]
MRFRTLIVTFLAVCLGVFSVNAKALAVVPSSMTYDQVKGTGLADSCPTLPTGTGDTISVGGSAYITDLCFQPTSFFVKEEPKNPRQEAEFVPASVMTRKTTTLEQIEGPLSADGGGLTFKEKDGMDFQAITVQISGRERVPMLFTVKELLASASGSSIADGTSFSGEYAVPSYRTSGFLDPKGRGVSTGYDNAVALPASADADKLNRANAKRFDLTKGSISMDVASVDSETGEFGGTFESEQFSDSDLGAIDPLEVKVRGIFYGRVN